MSIQVNEKELASYLEQFSHESHGDRFEQDYGHLVRGEFPNCERFWQVFVVPLTQRMTSSRDDNPDWIRFRQDLENSRRLEDIAMAHYSMFFNLFCAHLHAGTQELYSFEDVYVRLASAYDLADAVLEEWYAVLVECGGEDSKILTRMTRRDFMEIAGDIYDKEYADIYDHYLSKGRFYRFEVPKGRYLLHEYLGDEDWWADFEYQRNEVIRRYRNRIVHDLRIARILESGDTYWVPKPECIGKYKTWREVEDMVDDPDVRERDFAKMWDQAPSDICRVENLLNTVWDKLITDFLEEFYSPDRDALRQMFDIKFLDASSSADVWEYLPDAADTRAGPAEQFETDSATETFDLEELSAIRDGPASDILTKGSGIWQKSEEDDK